MTGWLGRKWKGIDERYKLPIVGFVTFAISMGAGLYAIHEPRQAFVAGFYVFVASCAFTALSVRSNKRKWDRQRQFFQLAAETTRMLHETERRRQAPQQEPEDEDL